MQRQPNNLNIPRGALKTAIWAFVKAHGLPLWFTFYSGEQAFRHGFRENVWVECLLIVAFIFLTLHMVSLIRVFVAALNTDTPYLKMDRTGL